VAVVKLLSQAEYAEHRGCSAVAVHKAVKAGRISLIGKLIDPAVADIQWEQNTRARTRNVGTAPAPGQAPGADLVTQAAAAGSPAAPPTVPDSPIVDTGYTQARARRENAEAEQAEIDLRKRKGELVERIDVDRAGYEIARDIRDAMESSVNAAAAEMASMTSAEACAEALRRHNRAICDLLVRGFREKLGASPSGAAA
jgi:hypothetical protein